MQAVVYCDSYVGFGKADQLCPICLESMDGDKIYILNCNHLYHIECFNRYIVHDYTELNTISCPLCRQVSRVNIIYPANEERMIPSWPCSLSTLFQILIVTFLCFITSFVLYYIMQ